MHCSNQFTLIHTHTLTHTHTHSHTHITVKYYGSDTGHIIMRTSRDFFKLVSTSLVFITAVKRHQCSFKTLHLGGERAGGKEVVSIRTLSNSRRPIVTNGLSVLLDEDLASSTRRSQSGLGTPVFLLLFSTCLVLIFGVEQSFLSFCQKFSLL
jgi:hypothetical protein